LRHDYYKTLIITAEDLNIMKMIWPNFKRISWDQEFMGWCVRDHGGYALLSVSGYRNDNSGEVIDTIIDVYLRNLDYNWLD